MKLNINVMSQTYVWIFLSIMNVIWAEYKCLYYCHAVESYEKN